MKRHEVAPRGDFYCPQRSCGEVMFLHLSVILSTGGGCLPQNIPGYTHSPGQTLGECLRQCMLGYTPPGRHPLGRHPSGQTPSWAGIPLAGIAQGRHSPGRHPLGRHPLGRHPLCKHLPSWADTPRADTPPPPTVTALLECILVRNATSLLIATPS